MLREEKSKNHSLENIESRNAMYSTYSLNWDRNSWLKKKHVLSSYPLKRMYKERTRSFLSTSYANQHWEFAIYYKPITSLADDSPIEFVIPRHRENSLDLTHIMLSLHIRVESDRGESTSIALDGRAKVGPINHLWVAFHVQPNRRIFQSKAHIAIKQRLRVPRVHRGIIKFHLQKSPI